MTTTHILKLDFGVTCTATIDLETGLFDCVWDPSPPFPRKLAKRILRKYRPWRDKIFRDYAESSGKKILLVEI